MTYQSFIFLDIDGPINTEVNKKKQAAAGKSTSSFHIELPKKQLKLLRDIVNATGANIILSSKWRLRYFNNSDGSITVLDKSPAVENLENQLASYGMKLYGETPYMYNIRGIEIKIWLDNFIENNGYLPPYIILDDNISNILDEHRGHIIYCSPVYGLTVKEANIAINLLEKQKYFMTIT